MLRSHFCCCVLCAALGLTLVFLLLLTPQPAHAQAPDLRLLGFQSTLSAHCNVGCTQLTLQLVLGATRATDNSGAAVPGPIAALTDYLRNVTFQVFGSSPTILSVSGAPVGYTTTIDNGPSSFAAFVVTNPTLPLNANTLNLVATLAPGGNVAAVSANGLAYIDPMLAYRDATGAVVPVPPPLPPPPGGPFYQTGDLNVFVSPTTVPEPATLTLLATAGALLVGVRLRRRA